MVATLQEAFGNSQSQSTTEEKCPIIWQDSVDVNNYTYCGNYDKCSAPYNNQHVINEANAYGCSEAGDVVGMVIDGKNPPQNAGFIIR
jgi:hypothetical protein